MTAVLRISDGTTTISLLNGADGFFLNAWRPSITQYKGGGTWQSSPLSGGRRLATRQFNNTVEAFDLKVSSTSSQDDAIYRTQELRRLLEKAVDYWTADWQDEPVWVEAQATCETNSRYALIHSYSTPDDENPFSSPFLQPAGAIMDNWALVIERGHWLSDEPGTASCLGVSGEAESEYGGVLDLSPLVSYDDAWIATPAGTIWPTGVLEIGMGGAQAYDVGIRFRNVTIPQGATIRSAWVRFEASNTDAAALDVDIACEDADNSNIFSTYADFNGRARTAASINWVPGPGWTAGLFYDTPSIVTAVQEVVSRTGWASGNNLTVFLDDNASAGARRVGSVDTEPGTRKAYLYVSYGIGSDPGGATRGKGPSCDNDVFMGNKQTLAQLTHIFVNDGAAFSGNMIGETDFALFPAVPAVGDNIYYGIDNNADPGPFCSLAFNIGVAQLNIVTVWEYWNGAWVALTTQDNTAALQPYDTTGVNTVHWIPPADWATVAVNGVTGFWVRSNVTIVGAPTVPTQTTDQIYTIIWGHYRVDGADIGGDIPAAVDVQLENVSSGAGALVFYSRRLIGGLRSDSRGLPFTAYLNIADRGNPTGFTVDVSGDANTTIIARNHAPVGRATRWNAPAGASPLATRVEIIMDNDLALYYYGTFHVFMRVYQDGGTAGDFTTRLNFDAGLRFNTDTITVGSLGEFEVIDFGRVELPAATTLLSTDLLSDLYIDILIGNDPAAGVGDLWIYDLIFMPTDEWAGEFIYNDTASNVLLNGRRLDIDSVINPRQLIRANLEQVSIDVVLGPWRSVVNGEIIHQANTDQKMWTFGMYTSGTGWVARPETAHAVDVDAARRYLASRGAR